MLMEIQIAEVFLRGFLTKKDSVCLPLFVRENDLAGYWLAGRIGRCALIETNDSGIVGEKMKGHSGTILRVSVRTEMLPIGG
jgi:hypothetical protein